MQGSNGNAATVNRHGHSGRRRDWDELREQRGNTPSTVCKTDSQWGLLFEQGAQIWGSVTMKRGGKGREVGGRLKREGTYIRLWLVHADAWQKSKQHCKAIILELKINKFLKNERVFFFFL